MPNIDFLNLFDGETLNDWKMAGKGSFAYFKKRMYSKHKKEWAYYGITKGNSKILFWNLNGRRLVREIIQESLLGSQIQEMILMLQLVMDMKYKLMILPSQMVSQFMGTGAIYETAAPSIMNSKPTGQWNSLQITAEKQKYTVMVNDIVVITNFTGHRLLEGYIGLQNHDNRSKVFFRNIKVGEIL